GFCGPRKGAPPRCDLAPYALSRPVTPIFSSALDRRFGANPKKSPAPPCGGRGAKARARRMASGRSDGARTSSRSVLGGRVADFRRFHALFLAVLLGVGHGDLDAARSAVAQRDLQLERGVEREAPVLVPVLVAEDITGGALHARPQVLVPATRLRA